MAVKLDYFVLIGLLWIISISETSSETLREVFSKYNYPCSMYEYRCKNLECISSNLYCNGNRDCSDGSDEDACSNYNCPAHAPFHCNDRAYIKCIPYSFVCNGRYDCLDRRDEVNCKENIKAHFSTKHFYRAASLAQKFMHRLRKRDQLIRKWGTDIRRIAVALHLSYDEIFYTNKTIRYEISNELSVGLLSRLALRKIDDISSTELASYINAFLVSCINPRKFYVVDLVKELRKRVDTQNHTLPYVMLSLCTAGETLTERDVEKLKAFFSTAHQKHWTDMQALSLMALACASKQVVEGNEDLLELGELTTQLKARQNSNGTYETLKTTALVIQALLAVQSDEENFNAKDAMKQILLSQAEDGSFGSIMDTYSILPTLAFQTLADIGSSHCSNSVMDDFLMNSYFYEIAFTEKDKELVHDLENQLGAKWKIQISLWIGNNRTIERSFAIKVPPNISFQKLTEIEERLNKFRFVFSMRNGKPYIYSISGIQNDAEEGTYWFLFLRSKDTEEHLEPINPADVIPENNQHLVFWYKYGSWTEEIQL